MAAVCCTAGAQNQIDIRNGVYRGRPVTYRVVDGFAIAEGDIILGPADEIGAATAAAARVDAPAGRTLLATDTSLRWTNATIPYRIDSDIPNQQRVMDAVAYWNANTVIHMTPWAGEPNRVRFIRQQSFGVCFSSVGMVGGEQTIRVDDACNAGALIHEIGHAVGLYHEQARPDRDRYVSMALDNVQQTLANNFGYNFGAVETGPYDYGAIMGYGRYNDTRDPLRPTIETRPAGMPIGLYLTLSPQEIAVVGQMYGQAPGGTLISSNPAGLTILVDGAPVETPQTFNWAVGETHTLEAQGPQGDDTVRYVFGRWSDDGDAAHTITVADGLSVYNASFIREYPLRTAVSGNGTVAADRPSDDGFYVDGTVVTLTATPAAGNSFRGWSGFQSTLEGLGANPVKVRLNFAGANYTANFISRTPTVITTDPPVIPIVVDGSSWVGPRGLDWANNTTHTFSVASPVTPKAGVRYVFQKWSDGNTSLTRNVTATTPTNFTAIYTTQYQISFGTSGGGGGTVRTTPSSSDGFYDKGTKVQVTATPMNAGTFANWTGDFTGTAAAHTVALNDTIFVTANFPNAGGMNTSSVVHAATLQPGPVAPGQQITIYGVAIGPDQAMTADPAAGPVTRLGGTSVLFDGTPAQMLMASAGRVMAVAPASVAGNPTTAVHLDVNGKTSPTVTLGVLDTYPGLFTADGSGSGAVQTVGGGGPTISLLATGVGLVDGSGAPLAPLQVWIGGQQAVVSNVGPADGQPGVVRIDATMPDGVGSGAAVRLVCGYVESPAGTTLP